MEICVEGFVYDLVYCEKWPFRGFVRTNISIEAVTHHQVIIIQVFQRMTSYINPIEVDWKHTTLIMNS